MKKILSIIACSIIIFGCEKEKIVEVEKEISTTYNWKTHEGFQHQNALIMNSYNSDDMLFFTGLYNFISMVPEGTTHPDGSFGGNIEYYANWNIPLANSKLPLHADYSISYDIEFGSVIIFPTRKPLLESSTVKINLVNIDAAFMDFKLTHYLSGESFLINNQNQILIPYQSSEGYRFALIDIIPGEAPLYGLTLGNMQIITISDSGQTSNISLNTIGSDFFVTTDSKVYKIDTEGNIQNVVEDDRLYKILDISGQYYGFSYDYLYISNDQGTSWTRSYEISPDLRLPNYTTNEDKVIAYYYDNIWEMTITETEISSRELDNDGLVGNQLTSLSSFDNKVYATTLSGVYYKDASLFLDSKLE